MDNQVKSYTTYLAGYIESNPSGCEDWRSDWSDKIKSDKILIYNPLKYEAVKTGKNACDHIKYVSKLREQLKFKDMNKDDDIPTEFYRDFCEEMRKIWYGNTNPGVFRFEIIKVFQQRSIIDGNRSRDLNYWGDFEAVARSTFIIVDYKHTIPTWGTPAEAVLAFFLNIPIYLISDVPPTKINGSLLWWTMETGGRIFKNIDDNINYLRSKYKL